MNFDFQGEESKSKQKETYKISFGWMIKNGENLKYVMPRQGGVAKKVDVPRKAAYSEVLQLALSLYKISELHEDDYL